MKTRMNTQGGISRRRWEMTAAELDVEFEQGRVNDFNDHVRHLLFRENADSVEIHKLDPVVTYAPANNPSDEHQLGGQTYDHNNRE